MKLTPFSWKKEEELALEVDDGKSCCYVSVFGLGPAWTV
jgi:hypothetical protein